MARAYVVAIRKDPFIEDAFNAIVSKGDYYRKATYRGFKPTKEEVLKDFRSNPKDFILTVF